MLLHTQQALVEPEFRRIWGVTIFIPDFTETIEYDSFRSRNYWSHFGSFAVAFEFWNSNLQRTYPMEIR